MLSNGKAALVFSFFTDVSITLVASIFTGAGSAFGCSAGFSSAAGAALAVLPLSAIYQTEDTPKVWVVDKDSMTVSLKDVTVVSTGDNKVSVKGLSPDDIVVVAGVHKLREGTRVRLSEGDN